MTHKIALSLALFATFGMTACTVDAPTPEDFNYSFFEELPGGLTPVDSLTTYEQPLVSQLVVEFRDSLHGTEQVPEAVAFVPLTLHGVYLGTHDAEGGMTWRTVASKPTELDLMALADGDTETIAAGPVPEGHYSAIAFQVAKLEMVTDRGDVYELGLPGPVVVIEEEFELDPYEEHGFVVQFGGLRGIEFGADGWVTDPNVSFVPAPE